MDRDLILELIRKIFAYESNTMHLLTDISFRSQIIYQSMNAQLIFRCENFSYEFKNRILALSSLFIYTIYNLKISHRYSLLYNTAISAVYKIQRNIIIDII